MENREAVQSAISIIFEPRLLAYYCHWYSLTIEILTVGFIFRLGFYVVTFPTIFV